MNHNPTGPRSEEASEHALLSQLRGLEDAELAAKLAAGCHDALTVLFERHSPLVFRIARRILRNDGEAEEAVQQVFLNIYRAISQFDPGKGSFTTWLLQFAYHRAINRKKHLFTQRFYNLQQLDEEFPETGPDGMGGPFQQSPQEVSHLIWQLLSAIKPLQRKVIELTFFHGLTAEEIARRTGETPAVIRHNLYRGLGKLRSVLFDKKEVCNKETADTGDLEKDIVIAYRPPKL